MWPVVVVLILSLCFLIAVTTSAQVSALPAELTDQEFWRLITEFSEPSGPYTGDNWISNEASI